MDDYNNIVIGRKRKEGTGNIKSTSIPTRAMAMRGVLAKNMPGKMALARPKFARRGVATARLVNSMDLDEMLEASKVIEMGMKGEAIPVVKSPKALRYAGTILRLNKRDNTKPMAEKMMHDLNTQIIKVNRETTDAVEVPAAFKSKPCPF